MASTMGDVSKRLKNIQKFTVLSVAVVILSTTSVTKSQGIGDRRNDPLQFQAGAKLPIMNDANINNVPLPPDLNARPNADRFMQGVGENNRLADRNNFNPNNRLMKPGNLQNPDTVYSKKKLVSDRISSSIECKGEYEKLCPKTSKMNNFAVLECLQNTNKDTGTMLSQECNQHLWNYKRNLTEDTRFKDAASTVCRKVEACQGLKQGGEVMSCLIDNLNEISDTHCRQFVSRMQIITFSDYRLIQRFYEKCSTSVTKLSCGSVHQDGELSHLQGQTIQCLEKHLGKLDASCKTEILRVAELTADDYQKDRALYFACRDDRERFCEKEIAGEGRIYKCLENHKKEKQMSTECFEALTTRQKMVASDVKVDKQLIKNCRIEIKERGCLSPQNGKLELSLSSLLLCLEAEPDRQNGAKSVSPLSGECQAELFDIRKSLMEDYKVNPEIVTLCESDIEQYCKGLRREGKTLHCLMERAMKKKLAEQCTNAVMDLLKEVKAGSDFRLDPILAKSCEKSKGALCSQVKSGDAKVLSCLMDNIESELMEEKCANKLFELQYFISKDMKLDTKLYKSCKKDVLQCATDERRMDSYTFACLHNRLHSREHPLSPDCSTQVHRALRQRASMVSLNPLIEKHCRADLGKYCPSAEEEFVCLQENYEELTEECKGSIRSFTEEESEDVRMNKALMKACSPMLKQYCQESLKRKVDEGDALQCLISHKNDASMDPKCAAGIEHFQIIQLKDYTLSFKFKQACRTDVTRLCTKKSSKKDSILACLSTYIRADTLLGNKQNVSEGCRAQMQFEMLQESEDIQLDPKLYKACKVDLDKFCAIRTKTDSDSLECLRKHDDNLREECYNALFSKTKELQEKPDWDYYLMKVCQNFIKTTCKSSAEPLMDCLQNHLHDSSMDSSCKEAVSQRMREEAKDFRLNPTMKRVCMIDMGKYCNDIRKKARNDRQMDLQGGMMKCLQGQLDVTDAKKKLTPLCEKYIRHFMVEAALNFELDPQMKRSCTEDVKQYCSEKVLHPGEGMVLECLKKLLIQKKLSPGCQSSVIKMTQEGLTDIHVDPQLAQACRLDLKHYCHGVMRGQGQQMACLLEALDTKTVRLQVECKTMLEQRKELWEYAAEVAPPETFQELYLQIYQSPSRNHFFMSLLSFIAGVLFFGVCCGRATKRVAPGVKNK